MSVANELAARSYSYIYTIIAFLISLFMLFYVLCPADNCQRYCSYVTIVLCIRHCK